MMLVCFGGIMCLKGLKNISQFISKEGSNIVVASSRIIIVKNNTGTNVKTFN